MPDCFTIDYTVSLAKVGRISGAIEYTEIYRLSPNEFWFNCNCTNITITQLFNSGSDNTS
jgi:hypothetical protein